MSKTEHVDPTDIHGCDDDDDDDMHPVAIAALVVLVGVVVVIDFFAQPFRRRN